MSDPATLARQARRALARAHTATLLVEGLGRVLPCDGQVLLDDHEGRPRFTCAAGSPVAAAAAARCPAILDVGVSAAETPGVGAVIFAGHLSVADAPDPGGAQVVELQLISVVVETDDPLSRAVVTRRVPLEVYAEHGPPSLTAAAETMRVHTNARHPERLRACAAARAGVEDGDVIVARLIAVDPAGATLDWLDSDGGKSVRLQFPRTARDGRELAALLRAQLCAHHDGVLE